MGQNMWNEIYVGYEIPPLVKTPTHMNLFMFSAITWNTHLIHYNLGHAKEYGLPDVAVHRGLLGNFLCQMLQQWVGEEGRISRQSWAVRGTAFPGQAVKCRGKVVQKTVAGRTKLAKCQLWIENHLKARVAEGEAEMVFFE